MIKRMLFFVVGLLMITPGVSMIIKSNVGAGPWDAAYAGLEKNVGLTIGIWIILVQSMMLIINALLTKKRPEFESILTFVVLGLLVDFWTKIAFADVTLFTETPVHQWLFFILGIVLLSIGSGFYITSNLPKAPYDSLMVNIAAKLRMSISKSRSMLEIFALILALIVGGPVGIGTIIIGLGIGYFIQLSVALAQKLFSRI